MKALLVIFAIYINYVISENNKYAVKNFPKKVRPYGNGKILINSGKYMFKSPKPDKPTTATDKRVYTVFQVVGNSKAIQGVPDSPYFPVDQSYDHKPRVKKVLPDYTWTSLRSKRSAEKDVPSDGKDEKEKEPEKNDDAKTESTTEAPVDKKEKKEDKGDDKDTKAEVKKEEKSEKLETKSSTTEESKKGNKTETASNIRSRVEKEEKATDKKDDSTTTKSDEAKKEKISEVKSNKTDTQSDKISKPEMRSKADNSTEISDGNQKSKDIQSTTEASQKNATSIKPKSRAGKRKKSKKLKQRKGKSKSKAKKKRNPPQRSKKSRNKKALKKKQTNGTRTFKSPKVERRLIAAREALIEDYPYVVSIQKNDQHWCSGALLNPRLVITTANCLWKASRVSRMEVRAGSRNLDRGGQLAAIQEVMKHPGWGLRRNPDNDVALVLLDRNIRFSDSVHGVDLPNRVMMPPFDDAWVTSWGAERRDGVYDTDSTTLQVYHTRLIDRAKCNNVTMRFNVFVSENFICLAQSGKTAPCTRDTGAPAVSDGILWGLASWGIRKLCGTERFPAMFSYLASHTNLEFITNATHLLMSDKRYYPFADRFPVVRAPSSSSSSESRV